MYILPPINNGSLALEFCLGELYSISLIVQVIRWLINYNHTWWPIVLVSHAWIEFVWSRKHLLGNSNSKIYIREHYSAQIEANIRKLLPIRRAAIDQQMKVRLIEDRLTINSQLYTIDNLHQLPESLKVEKLAIREEKDHIFFIQKQPSLVTFTYHILPLRDNPSVVVNNIYKTVKPTYSMTRTALRK